MGTAVTAMGTYLDGVRDGKEICRVEWEKQRALVSEMAAVIRHFMAAPPDEKEVRRRVSFEAAEIIYSASPE